MDTSTGTPSTDFISYPSLEAGPSITSTSKPCKKTTVEDRLYIGGLHPSVDEVTLWKVLKDYSPERIDFPVHTAGTLQGRSRGFAFVHFHDKEWNQPYFP
jgi:RNA recognition motif-containing protein